MKCSARELANRLHAAGIAAKARQNKHQRSKPSLHFQAEDMVLALTCALHREKRKKHIWQIAFSSAATFALVCFLLALV